MAAIERKDYLGIRFLLQSCSLLSRVLQYTATLYTSNRYIIEARERKIRRPRKGEIMCTVFDYVLGT